MAINRKAEIVLERQNMTFNAMSANLFLALTSWWKKDYYIHRVKTISCFLFNSWLIPLPEITFVKLKCCYMLIFLIYRCIVYRLRYSSSVVLKLVGSIEPNRCHASIHRTLNYNQERIQKILEGNAVLY